MKGRSWRIDCILVLVACHKFGKGDCAYSLHEFSKSACVGEGQGQTKAFLTFCVFGQTKNKCSSSSIFPKS